MDLLQEYDAAFFTKLGATQTTTPDGRPYFKVDVAGVVNNAGQPQPVSLILGMPEEWFKRYEVPGIAVRRLAVMHDPERVQPGFQGTELSVNPDTPNTWNVQAQTSVPVRLLYAVQIKTDSMQDMNLILLYVLSKLPLGNAFGTVLQVGGRWMPFESRGVMDKTDYKVTEGRQFVYEYTYSVQGWIISLECQKVEQILTTEVTVALDS
jgi:hypothetical protein